MSSILKVDTIQDSSGNNIINESSNTITIGASGDTTNIVGTLQNDGASLANTPSFAVRLSGSQSIANATNTVLQFNTEDWDTDSAYDTSSYRFVVPSGGAGKYFFHARVYIEWGNAAGEIGRLQIAKNGTAMAIDAMTESGDPTSGSSIRITTLLDLAVADYVDVRLYHNQGGSQDADNDSDFTYFTGYKLIGA
tara:strand:+ start:19 stop:600 length:582 start_codon:yes stop_codon:yes gene_type:complete